VRKNKHLATLSAAAMAVATLVGTSAFADSRPANETRGGRVMVSRDRSAGRTGASHGNNSSNAPSTRQAASERQNADHGSARTFDRSGNGGSFDRNRDTRSNESSRVEARTFNRDSAGTRSFDRNQRNDNRSFDRNTRSGNDSLHDRGRSNDSRRDSSWRGDNRSHGDNRSFSQRNGTFGNREHFSFHGRVSNIVHFGSGYRIWIGGAPYPFFVSDSYYRRNRFRIGVNIALGGYYNPLGYYDYDDGYYNDSTYSNGALRGVVESVDYRRDTFVVRNEATGSFVTVASRSRYDNVRPGDYVEITGDWTRSGFFEAYNVALLNDGYRR
jgi:hypothetical protein